MGDWTLLEVIFDLHHLQTQLTELDARSSELDFWNDPDFANKTLQKAARIRGVAQPYLQLDKAEQDIAELYEMLRQEADTDTEREADQMALKFLTDSRRLLELKTLMSGEYDAVGTPCWRSTPGRVARKRATGR